MTRNAFRIIVIVLSVAILMLFGRLLLYEQPQQTRVAVSPPQDRSVYIGAWVGGFWNNDKKTLDTTVAKQFQDKIHKKLAIVNIYSEWAYLSNPKLLNTLDEIGQSEWTPMISANPYFFTGCPNTGESLYATIAGGDCDAFLSAVAVNLRSYQKPILLRFAWEMNLPNMYWSTAKTKSSPQDFVAAWKHIHDIFRNESADNVKWVLSFNTSSATTVPYASLFPGDAYVDWVAIDGYNWGNTHDWSKWTSFNGVFRNSYNELTALTAKPVMLSEVNSAPTGTGGNKAQWLHDMLTTQVPQNFPQVEAIIFFNENKKEGEKIDWRIETSSKDLATVQTDIQKNIYKSSF